VNCPKCQHPLQQSFKFCPYCGSQAINNSLCPTCQYKVEPAWIACPSCGGTLVSNVSHSESVQPEKLTNDLSNDHGHGHGHRHGHHSRSNSGKHTR